MAKPKDAKPVADSAPKDLDSLKALAKGFRTYMNAQYHDAVAYVPDSAKIASVEVKKWLTLPPAIQEAIGLPGFPMGNIVHIYGKSNTGKTTMLMQAMASAQKQGILPILILTEHKFDFSRLSDFMGADPEAMLVFNAGSIEQAYGYIEKVLLDLKAGKMVIEGEDGKDQEIDLTNQDCFIFLDSIGNTLSESELEYEVKDHDKSMGKSAKALKTLTRRVNQHLNHVKDKCGILLLNQSYQSLPAYGPSVETAYGGEGIIYSCVLNLRLKRVGDLKMTIKGRETIIGLETKIEVKKNHVSHKMNICSVYTVASGMIPADKAALDDYKKHFLK